MTHSPPAHSYGIRGENLGGRHNQQVTDIDQDIQDGDQGDGNHHCPHQVLLQGQGEEGKG